MAVGAAGFVLAPGWPWALAAAFLGGLGFGGSDYGLNQLFAVGFERRSPAMLNVLNAHFGIGAVLGPAALAALGPDRWAYAFAGCAVLSGALALSTRGVSDAPGSPDRAGMPKATRRPGLLRSPLFLGFVALYALNVGVEAGVGGWEPTHLESLGYSSAASATSVYWLMLTAGRFLVVRLALRWTPERILTVCGAGMTACLLPALLPGAAAVAYAGVGLFIAPVFPTGLPWLHRALPSARSAGAWVIAASMAGGVAAPPLLGLGIERSGVAAVPVLLALLSAAALAVTVRLARRARTGAAAGGTAQPLGATSPNS
ncbi:MFS transporter [Streptomyces sp. NRRL F-5727]|uniref:MFS transporter n=1 Tax=Streptomyces sp. NRRL F-5727 TaxID=1463871 RepID=UPI003B632EDB